MLAERDDRLRAGAVGYQRTNLGRRLPSVAPLRAVQESLLEAEPPVIARLCRW